MLKIDENSSNYAATVVKLNVLQDVAGLDNLKSVSVFGNQCLIGKDSNLDEIYLYFPCECKLSPDFLSGNNLYRHETNNKDTTKKGFFEDTGRVKALKFKGVISSCFIIPLKSLENIDINISKLKVGDEFTSINNIEICRKYVVRNQDSSGGGKTKNQRRLERFDKLVPNQFRFHEDTSQLAKNLHRLDPNDVIVITDKWHGTSAVFGNVIVKKDLKFHQKLLKKLKFDIKDRDYDIIYSSRKVVKNQYINKEVQSNLGFYNEDIWAVVKKELEGKIEQGISLYGEIVGYLQSGKAIQGDYDYGCKEGEHKFIVYRITYTKPDGNVIEFSWQQIKDYCRKFGIDCVKELYFGNLRQLHRDLTGKNNDSFWQEDLLNSLQSSFNLEKTCNHCFNNVPAEGICLRVDGKESYSTFKLKAKAFLLKESKDLDKGVENIEDLIEENA